MAVEHVEGADELRVAHRRAQLASDGAEGQVGEAIHRREDQVAIDRQRSDPEDRLRLFSILTRTHTGRIADFGNLWGGERGESKTFYRRKKRKGTKI